MNKREQVKFIESLCNSIKLEIISKIESDRIPTNWSGPELRRLIAEKFAAENRCTVVNTYANDVLINNL